MPKQDSPSIKKNQSSPNPARKGMFAGQKLKIFIAVSVAAHASTSARPRSPSATRPDSTSPAFDPEY